MIGVPCLDRAVIAARPAHPAVAVHHDSDRAPGVTPGPVATGHIVRFDGVRGDWRSGPLTAFQPGNVQKGCERVAWL